MRKGQVFIILGVIVISTLVVLKISMNLTNILNDKKYLESGLERLEFSNFKNEMVKTIQISYNDSENMTNNLNDFAKYARDVFSSRTIELNGILIESSFPTVSASTDTRLNVTVLNLLGIPLQNLNISFSSSSDNRTSIGDDIVIKTNFTFNTNANTNYSLIVFYQTSSTNSTENITIPVEIGKSKFIGFFDFKLISDRLEQRDKITQTVTLSS